jgi:hypothetical protein
MSEVLPNNIIHPTHAGIILFQPQTFWAGDDER